MMSGGRLPRRRILHRFSGQYLMKKICWEGRLYYDITSAKVTKIEFKNDQLFLNAAATAISQFVKSTSYLTIFGGLSKPPIVTVDHLC